MRLLPLIAACWLTGCVLDTETCGSGFVADGERCVPARPPPPFGGGAAADAGADARLDDAAAPPDWSAFVAVEIRDLTALGEAAREPESPGADVDAVSVAGDDGFVGWAEQVRDSFVADPTGANRFGDPRAALGPPDARGRAGGHVALGADGGRLLLWLALRRPLASGDVLTVHERALDGGSDDRYAIGLCLLRDAGGLAADCVPLGEAGGRADFRLP